MVAFTLLSRKDGQNQTQMRRTATSATRRHNFRESIDSSERIHWKKFTFAKSPLTSFQANFLFRSNKLRWSTLRVCATHEDWTRIEQTFGQSFQCLTSSPKCTVSCLLSKRTSPWPTMSFAIPSTNYFANCTKVPPKTLFSALRIVSPTILASGFHINIKIGT